ncbi:MAG TPA: hypothetical protein VET87_08145 [Rubrivivax sp.]|nr:hypothetical protein [Rubrivivax sp.]
MREFFGPEQARWHAKGKAVRTHYQQAMVHAQPQRRQVHVRALAAMAVEHHQLLHTGSRHAAADGQPQAEQVIQIGAQRAGECRVLQAVADGQCRKHQQRSRWRQALQCLGHHALIDQRVGGQRQVRAMLLDRRHRQQGDRARRVDACEVRGRQFLPISTGQACWRRVGARGVHRDWGVR